MGFELFGHTLNASGLIVGAAFFMINIIFSSIVAMLGFTYLWGINEVIEQEEWVKKGWFPMNPKRK